MKEQYAVCHLQRGSGNDSGMSCHIERKDAQGKTYVPDNADRSRTHLNMELVSFLDGVRNRTEAIQYRIDNAGLSRKVAGNQCKAIRIILTGTHEQMMKIQEEGRLDKWMKVNLKWLHETFGKENVVSCVLHMDEKTPHLHATIVPIVTAERQRREREGERKYNTKSGPRLSADDVLKRAKLREYQNTYAAAMSEFGLKRGIVGSTARHIATSTHYKQQMQLLEEDIANLQKEVEKTKEGKSTIFAIFGKGDLAKARKELAKLQAQIAKLEAEGHKCYNVPIGGSTFVGAAAFAKGYVELQEQLEDANGRVLTLEQTSQAGNSELEELKEQLAAETLQKEDLTQKCQDFEAKLAEMQTTISQTSENIDDVVARLEKVLEENGASYNNN